MLWYEVEEAFSIEVGSQSRREERLVMIEEASSLSSSIGSLIVTPFFP